MDAVEEIGTNPVSKHQIQPGCVENEQADAGRDGRTCRTRPNSQARMGTGKKNIFPIQLFHIQYQVLYIYSIQTLG